ncbi:MAG: helix-turn-helix transcriptional regulator [Aminipila sp.]
MQIERLIKMIFLLVNEEYKTAQEIADYLNISKRTVLRDINTLTLSGFPLYTTRGKNGGIGILKEYTIDKAHFSKEEQNKIIHGLQLLESTHFPDAKHVLNKVSTLFKKTKKPNWIEVDFSFFGSEETEKIKFSNIEESILNKFILQFDYFTSELQFNHRCVEPLRLLFKEHAWYIQGYCCFKKDICLFRMSRMKNLKITNEHFERDLPKDLPTNLDYSKSYDLHLFKLHFSSKIAHRIYDEYEEKYVQICEDNSFLVNYHYAINEWVIRHLLSFGTYVEVLEPASVRVLLKERAKEIMNIYK